MKLTLYNKKGQTVHSKLLWFTMKFSLQTHVVRVQLPSDGVWEMNGLQELWVYGSITPLMELKSEPTVWRRQNCGHWDLVGRTASVVEFLKDGCILPLSMLPFLCCLPLGWAASSFCAFLPGCLCLALGLKVIVSPFYRLGTSETRTWINTPKGCLLNQHASDKSCHG